MYVCAFCGIQEYTAHFKICLNCLRDNILRYDLTLGNGRYPIPFLDLGLEEETGEQEWLTKKDSGGTHL
jgi:hypothetical protein